MEAKPPVKGEDRKMVELEKIKVIEEDGKIVDELQLPARVASEIVDSWDGPTNQVGGLACRANIDILSNEITVSCQQGYGYAELLATLRKASAKYAPR